MAAQNDSNGKSVRTSALCNYFNVQTYERDVFRSSREKTLLIPGSELVSLSLPPLALILDENADTAWEFQARRRDSASLD